MDSIQIQFLCLNLTNFLVSIVYYQYSRIIVNLKKNYYAQRKGQSFTAPRISTVII